MVNDQVYMTGPTRRRKKLRGIDNEAAVPQVVNAPVPMTDIQKRKVKWKDIESTENMSELLLVGSSNVEIYYAHS